MSWQWRMMQNLKRNWLVISKFTWWIWRVLNPALESLKIFNLMCSFWAKYIFFKLKKYRGVSFKKLKRNTKFGEESTCRVKIGMRNLTKFDLSARKSQRFSFSWAPLSKVYIVWAKNVQRSYLSWHWQVMKNLKKNWFVAWKMTWGIWQILTRALEGVKTWTLMGSFCPK